MTQERRKTFVMLINKGVMVRSWEKIEDNIRAVLEEAIKDGYSVMRIGYVGEISPKVLEMLAQLKSKCAENIFIEAVVLSFEAMPKSKSHIDTIKNICNGVSLLSVRSDSQALSFTRDMIFTADRVAAIKYEDALDSQNHKDYIWFALDYAVYLEKELRMIEATRKG